MSEPRARLVTEEAEGFHDAAGPWANIRIGFSLDDRVFWTGLITHPGDNNESAARKRAYAQWIVDRLNAEPSPPPEPSP